MKFTHNCEFNFSTEKNHLTDWLKHKAMLGEPLVDVSEVICFCTGLTRTHFKYLFEKLSIDKNKTDFDLENLKIQTRAGYHCAQCSIDLKNYWDLLLAQKDLLKDRPHFEKTRFDKNGKRQSYLGKYPTYWIENLVELQREWQEREDFIEKFSFKIIDAPIPFIDYKLVGNCDEKKAQIYFSHFHQFVEQKTNARWYFSLLEN